MIWIILAVTTVAVVLYLFNIISVWVMLGAGFAVAFFAAWRFDRARGSSATPKFLDSNKPELYAPTASQTWQVPTSYIDHPSGTGPPPGVELYDEDAVERLLTDRGESSTTQRDSDPAP